MKYLLRSSAYLVSVHKTQTHIRTRLKCEIETHQPIMFKSETNPKMKSNKMGGRRMMRVSSNTQKRYMHKIPMHRDPFSCVVFYFDAANTQWTLIIKILFEICNGFSNGFCPSYVFHRCNLSLLGHLSVADEAACMCEM